MITLYIINYPQRLHHPAGRTDVDNCRNIKSNDNVDKVMIMMEIESNDNDNDTLTDDNDDKISNDPKPQVFFR